MIPLCFWKVALTKSRVWALPVCITGFVWCGCGDALELPEIGAPLVRDSAGIEIIDHIGEFAEPRRRWLLAAEPTMILGDESIVGEPFFDRVVGGVLTKDGRVVIGDFGSSEIAVFTTSGASTVVFGGEGGGPGEFFKLVWLGAFGQGFVAGMDVQSGGVTVFDLDGNVRATYAVPSSSLSPFPQMLGVATSAEFFVMKAEVTTRSLKYAPDQTVRRDSIDVLVQDLNGPTHRFSLPGHDVYFTTSNGAWGTEPVIFGRVTHLAVGDRLVYAHFMDDFTIHGYTVDGILRRIIRLPYRPDVATKRDVQEMRQVLLDSVKIKAQLLWRRWPSLQRMAMTFGQKIVSELPHRNSIPAIGAMRVTSDGILWVRKFTKPTASTAVWYLFDPNGLFVRTVELNASLKVLDAHDGRVLVLAKDQFDVETVRVYTLTNIGS